MKKGPLRPPLVSAGLTRRALQEGASPEDEAPPEEEHDLDAVYVGRRDELHMFEGEGPTLAGVRIAGAPAPTRGESLRAYLTRLGRHR